MSWQKGWLQWPLLRNTVAFCPGNVAPQGVTIIPTK